MRRKWPWAIAILVVVGALIIVIFGAPEGLVVEGAGYLANVQAAELIYKKEYGVFMTTRAQVESVFRIPADNFKLIMNENELDASIRGAIPSNSRPFVSKDGFLIMLELKSKDGEIPKILSVGPEGKPVQVRF